MELVLIPPENIAQLWPLVVSDIERSVEGGEYTAEQLGADALEGKAQLWAVWDGDEALAAVVTAIEDLPDGRRCMIRTCGGKRMFEWLYLLDEIETWAKLQGCIGMRLFGRPGWKRVLPDYTVKRYVMDKEL